jgi:hypothetical protein
MTEQHDNRLTAVFACILIAVFLVTVFAAAFVPRTSLQATNVDDATTKAL